MCGITGVCNYKFNHRKNVEAMMNRMIHRGPDSGDMITIEDAGLTMGHRRLSIIDVTNNGSQPMTSHNGRYVIVFNGEIYNFPELKAQLLNDAELGINEKDFYGTSDTEVLLEMISAYGVHKAVSKCKGMFAFAVYDKKERALSLCRDRVGEKPLYYGRVGEAFVFASDIGSISCIEGFNNAINKDVLDLYFINGYIPSPYSIYEGICKLTPGTILTIKSPFDLQSDVIINPYWDFKSIACGGQKNLFKGSFEDAVDELDLRLRNSIRGQMISDVPLGAFLSAGIDSSTTVSLMQQLSSAKVKTFTIGMNDKEFNEAIYAKEIAEHLGTEHTELYITGDDAKDVIPKLPYIFAEPFADSSQIPTYLVSKMTREHVTVSLSGDAGDELFCGYTSYESVTGAWNKVKNIPYIIRKPISSIVLHSPLANNNATAIRASLLGARNAKDMYNLSLNCEPFITKIAFNKGEALSANDLFEAGCTGEPNHDIMLMNMLMYHPDDILVKVDRCAMAVSLETRVPMLDKDVVEFAWTLPIEYLYDANNKVGKRVLREVLYRYVPREMMDRPKKGFSIPIEKWLREDRKLRDWAESLIEPAKIKAQGYLNADVVSSLWKNYVNNNVWCIQIWYILMFQAWLEEENRACSFA